MASFAPSRFQKGRKAGADLSAAIFHAVKLDGSDDVILAVAGDEAIIYGFLINAPELGQFAEVATFGGGAKAKLAGTVTTGAALKISSTDGQMEAAVSTNLAAARGWEPGVSGDVIEIEPILFTVP